jgi:lipopolysaccharide transport system ATP-binding protein
MKPIIRVEGLSKQYRIGAKQASYATLRESLTNIAAAPFRRLRNTGNRPLTSDHPNTIWALKDVSFEVQPGEVVGIIGRNGAGKSTLLKILSRITEPTEGKVDLYGRVGSLLEVGTGFHAELTGRENIYLNGAILGMKHGEIARRFDEIVAFAEIEKFLDTPVKHYSSGMYMRLAFAVAAHLEPEILVVDEVLAVGDVEFQKKCLGKMSEVAQNGRTILFVSHNMDAVLRLCQQGILLGSGKIISQGAVKETVDKYLVTHAILDTDIDLSEYKRPVPVRGKANFSKIIGCSGSLVSAWSFSFGEKICFELVIEAEENINDIELGVALCSAKGFEVASWTTTCSNYSLKIKRGQNKVYIEYPDLKLLPGAYYLGIGIRSDRGFEDYLPDAATLEVMTNDKSSFAKMDTFAGAILPQIIARKLE